MNVNIQTIPELLVQTRGNITEAARRLNANRTTVKKYHKDTKPEHHAIINGVLMVTQGKRGAHKKVKPCKEA